ncbi:hypothetical protein [Paenibacillus apiarius]|uniref:Uncharacterized protein n=1 Tax=Paenibacillus apiarius TaxID=46240 RepID=A0ABT4DV73_9BACL|nr:hypothetical protein [Paenibacillus apiarius]MCY9516716.1 hypothetical protein [Paenibacillus apiarius]MCY9519886.1 hypothetical protein [Paenibacillus apiarius]MCY9553876.1 hypothetical protein [Paenibacillus apiarius]MCY9557516.1 hypothetical protein [Paenibacillus apiarius]MCY9685476.1 hypothetical protein [Paenibacillus apiarius]
MYAPIVEPPLSPAVHPSCSLPLLAHAALRLALLFHADVNHRVDGGAFASRERQQLMRQDAKLMEGVIGIVRLAVALPD